MERSSLITALEQYVANDILDGRSMDLDETTPLLEWGIINSLEIVRLINFVHRKFNVEIPVDSIIAENFVNVATIADLILALSLVEQQPR